VSSIDVWVALAAAFAAAAGVLFLPGAMVAASVGLRGVSLLGTAPLASVSVVVLSSLVAPAVGATWGLMIVGLMTLGLAAAGLAVSWLLQYLGWKVPGRDPWSTVVAGGAALGLGLALAATGVLPGLGRPDAVSQTYDANFHYNAVRLAVDSGNASPLNLGLLIHPGAESSFYPGAWHAVTSLVVMVAEPDIMTAANGVSLALAGLVWPASCLFLVRQVMGVAWAPLLVAGALCGAFVALPTRLLSFGVLFPNLTGYVLVPAALGLALSALRLARDDVVGWPRGCLGLGFGLIGVAVAHPNSLFPLAVVAAPAAAVAGARVTTRSWRSGRRPAVIAVWMVALAAVAAAVAVLSGSDQWNRVSAFDWPARMTVAQAAGEVALLAAVGGTAAWILSLTVLVGLVAAGRRPAWRWLAASYVAAAGLYILAAGSDSSLSLTLTGPWYNDAFRLAGILPIIGVPLAVIGVSESARFLNRQLAADADAPRSARPVLTSHAGLMLVMTILVVGLTGASYAPERAEALRGSYTVSSEHAKSPLLTADELAFFRELPHLVPPGVAVAGNPWTGSGLVYAVADRPVVFPHVEATWDSPRLVIAEGLRNVASDPEVCAATHELGVGYALEGGEPLWPDERAQTYPGLEDLGEAEGFELVDERGPTRLYRITACAEGGTAA
jgi:hypothetical protein